MRKHLCSIRESITRCINDEAGKEDNQFYIELDKSRYNEEDYKK